MEKYCFCVGYLLLLTLGGPGVGKGTQCRLLAQEFNYLHLSVGDLLREEAESGSLLGKEINERITKGQIVRMEITIRLLYSAMMRQDETQGDLIDGFPRQLDQAEAFEAEVVFD